ncbi:septum formation inhibitor Maf [Parashewanella curva]|uniref:dTTP/UTP pyrophosphatase n=1 Tax=Parashewanella curva TaxID=2338552 RepID=A0A3L8PW55_9GAMM|nr:Maf family protein [Parashewanella curva]RLV59029.1 septum formation inhibitor Maf [Parashewanella curva]
MKRLVLASTSPRRKELLNLILQLWPQQIFECVSPDIDETQCENETPKQLVERLAIEKAKAGLSLVDDENTVVIGSDTIVVIEDKVLGKPKDATDAKAILSRLSGACHQVMTAVALVTAQEVLACCVTTQVQFTELSDTDIEAYVASGEPMDKAGAYGIQGIGGTFVEQISGSHSAVIGLPMAETQALLKQILK